MKISINDLDYLIGEGTTSYVFSLKNHPNKVAKIAKSQNHQFQNELNIIQPLRGNPRFCFVSYPIIQFESATFSSSENRIDGYETLIDCLMIDRMGISLEEFMKLRNHAISF
jgi:predicted Ser/Thr protein kinase